MKLTQLLYAFITTLLCIPLIAELSFAASWTTCSGHPIGWSGGTSTLKFLPISFPQGHVWRRQFEKAVEAWNDVPGNGLTFSLTDDVNNSWNHSNGVSEVYWYNLNDPSVLAYTYTRYNCYWAFGWNYRYTEADIVFDTDDSWSTYFTYSTALSSPYSFESVALHEIGHALGLGHESSRIATMNPYYPNGGPITEQLRWEPHGDDRFGARVIRSSPSGQRDLSVSAFRLASTGGYSHPISGSNLIVPAHRNFDLDFTVENLGETYETFNIGFYISKNRYITTSDILLGQSVGGTAAAGASGTFSRSLTVPSTLPAGTYYVGYIIDHDNHVGENEQWVEYPSAALSGTKFYPTNYFRNNHISVNGSLAVSGVTTNPQYHVATEVLWDDVQVSSFGWNPNLIYIAMGPTLINSQITYGSCVTTLGIGSATIAAYPNPASSLTTLDFSSASPNVSILTSGLNVYIYPYPMSSPPNYIQTFALAPNGCFVASAPVPYRRPFVP